MNFMSYTSTKELRFAKNLKILLVEIMRKHPVKAKVILNYLRFAWTKSKKNANLAAITQEVKVTSQVTATTGAAGRQPQSFVQVSDGHQGGSSSSSGSNHGSGGSSGGSGSGGGGYYGGSSGGLGGCSGGGGNGNNDGNDGNHNRRNINNNKGSILDIELDFEELPQAANNSNNTAKWFQEHQDINAGKILDGLLSLKTEFPDDSSNGSNPGSSSSMDKPPDMASLDHATANLLQMSVPDPSTTFLDIGTDIGGCASLYEDDPFNLEHLLPSNFNMNQLDVLSGNGNNGRNGSMLSNMPHGPHESSVTLTSRNLLGDGPNIQQMTQHHPHELTATSPNNSSSMSNVAGGLTITATSITTNTQNSISSGHHQQPQNLPSSICASLYPETTISPVMGHRQNS